MSARHIGTGTASRNAETRAEVLARDEPPDADDDAPGSVLADGGAPAPRRSAFFAVVVGGFRGAARLGPSRRGPHDVALARLLLAILLLRGLLRVLELVVGGILGDEVLVERADDADERARRLGVNLRVRPIRNEPHQARRALLHRREQRAVTPDEGLIPSQERLRAALRARFRHPRPPPSRGAVQMPLTTEETGGLTPSAPAGARGPRDLISERYS